MENETPPPPDPATPPPTPNEGNAFTQQVQHQPVSARVLDRVTRGVTSTGLIVLDTPTEFILDFVQGVVRPFQFVARVVVPPTMIPKLLGVLEDNLNRYTQSFGPIPQLPKPPQRRPSIAEIYENFKLPEELLNGSYANNVRIGHSPAEFFIDFLTDFYPTAAVSSRIFMSPPHIPRLVETLKLSSSRRRQPPAEPQVPPEQQGE
jgi:hypothetical protein